MRVNDTPLDNVTTTVSVADTVRHIAEPTFAVKKRIIDLFMYQTVVRRILK